MSNTKPQPFYFAGPEDEKTLKTLKPRISKFLSEYCISEVDADNLADEIVKVINSNEQFHSQVLGFIKESESAELAIYETLNTLVSSKNSENDLQDSDQQSVEEVAKGNPDKKFLRARRAAPPVRLEFNHLPGAKRNNAFKDEEENNVISPDLEDDDVIPGKRTPNRLPDKLVPPQNDPVLARLDNTQDEKDEKRAIEHPFVEPKKYVKNGNNPIVKPPIPNSDGQNGQQREAANPRPKADADDRKDSFEGAQVVRGKADYNQNQHGGVNLRKNHNIGANGNGQNVGDNGDKEKRNPQEVQLINIMNLGERGVNPKPDLNADAGGNGPNPRDNFKVKQKVDASRLNKQGENPLPYVKMDQQGVRQGQGDGEPQNDAPQADKPSFNEPQLPNQQEGGVIHKQQNAAKGDDQKEPAEVGQKPPEVQEPPPKPHISDFTANIIKEATNSFIQIHQGDSFPYTFVNGMASLNFTVRFTSSSEVGAYDLVFHNCRKTAIDASFYPRAQNATFWSSVLNSPNSTGKKCETTQVVKILVK
ncbi:hypothetical protein ACTXT7_012188 [Hymenolepis weldensis]